MRRLKPKSEEDSKKRTTQFIVGGILIFIMLFSTLGYAFGGGSGGTSNAVKYNGYIFENVNGLWVLDKGGINFVFLYNPKETNDIVSTVKPINNYYSKPIYYSSKNNDATYELGRNLESVALRFLPACVEGEECEGDLPIKNCEDNFIIIEESDTNEIIQDNNCVYLKGNQEEMVKVVDEFLFKILGVKS